MKLPFGDCFDSPAAQALQQHWGDGCKSSLVSSKLLPCKRWKSKQGFYSITCSIVCEMKCSRGCLTATHQRPKANGSFSALVHGRSKFFSSRDQGTFLRRPLCESQRKNIFTPKTTSQHCNLHHSQTFAASELPPLEKECSRRW